MMHAVVQRRQLLTALAGVAAAWPRAVRAQQPKLPVIGYLDPGWPGARARRLAAFHKGLGELGYVEGRNVAVEYRWAQNEYNRLPALTADLVRHGVAVIVVPGSTPAALAAKAATASIPIVFSIGADPVQAGLVTSFNRPGGNVTGVISMSTQLGGKQLSLLRDLLPHAARLAVLTNPGNPAAGQFAKDVQTAASAIGFEVEVLSASVNRDIDVAFADLRQKRVDALLVAADSLFFNRRVPLVTLAVHHRIPVIYSGRDYPEAGGLISYGADTAEEDRQVGIYAGRVLKGDKPADLPVFRATKFELVINLHTAQLLGLDIPATLLALADEVIE
jgi:putative ABC transport system substrate-binding protein